MEHVFKKAMLFAVILYPFLNLYPAILKYQSGMQAAYWMKTNKPTTPVIAYKTASYSLEFYSAAEVSRNNDEDLLRQSALRHPVILYTTKGHADSLALHGFKLRLLQSFQYFPVSRIDIKFINPETRPSELKTMLLASVSAK